MERTLPAQVELARLRLNEFNAVVAALNYNQNNDIQIRPDVNGSDGYSGTPIVGRAPEGGVDRPGRQRGLLEEARRF